jgi:hypothetical protein
MFWRMRLRLRKTVTIAQWLGVRCAISTVEILPFAPDNQLPVTALRCTMAESPKESQVRLDWCISAATGGSGSAGSILSKGISHCCSSLSAGCNTHERATTA